MNYEISKTAAFEDRRPDFDEMMSEVRKGLLATPKTLPCKYFFDEKKFGLVPEDLRFAGILSDEDGNKFANFDCLRDC